MAFAVAAVVGVVQHEIWRDEAFTWLVLSSSDSFRELFDNLGYVGHPKTWYAFLFAVGKLLPGYWVLPALNIGAGVTSVYLLARFSPFGRRDKVLFALGFFPLFQYGVINRPYGLMVTLLFIYCVARTCRPERPIIQGVTLGLLASLHAIGLLFTGGALVVEVGRRIRLSPAGVERRVWMGFAAALAGVGGAAWQLLAGSPESLPLGGADVPRVLRSFSSAFLPDFSLFASQPFRVIGIAALWLPSWFVMKRRRVALAHYFLWTIGLVALFLIAYGGYRWHFGFYFVGFIAALWLDDTRAWEGRSLSGFFLTVVLAVQALIGVYAVAYDFTRPYSSGEGAAEYVQNEDLHRLARVGVLVRNDGAFSFDVDRAQSTIVHLDNHAIYDPVDRETVDYWQYYLQPHFSTRPISELVPALARVAQDVGDDLLVIVVRPPGQASVDLPEEIIELVDLPSGFDFGESISLYRFDRRT